MGLSSFRVLSLCSGVGGLDLGLKLARRDASTVCYCEIEAYCIQVLVERIKEGWLDDAPIWSDLKAFDCEPWRGKVDCVIGGYPCQPFSTAGQRRGADDPRHLWPNIRAIVECLKPSECFFENVAGHLSLGFETVADDLQTMGYKVAAGLFTAEEIGTPHKRERLFIVAKMDNATSSRVLSVQQSRQRNGIVEAGYNQLADSDIERLEGSESVRQRNGIDQLNLHGRREIFIFPPLSDETEKWENISENLKPAICRVANGMANRVDRLRACGNGVVPLQAAYAYTILSSSFST